MAEIEEQAAKAAAARAAIVADVPGRPAGPVRQDPRVLGRPSARRPLRRGQCGGCREMLSTVELNEIRAAAPDEVIRHEECRRILVRTADSGL